MLILPQTIDIFFFVLLDQGAIAMLGIENDSATKFLVSTARRIGKVKAIPIPDLS